ncbi:MAG: PaaI family thioesterase [Firmicutes bacterium]|nr:PaaI family thioesterase [Bacillota bacterium]
MNKNAGDNLIAKDRFAEYIGLELVHVQSGYALARMEIKDYHLNGVNVVQGGALFTLADYTFAAAANADGIVTLSIDAHISYFKPPQGRLLTAEAREISAGRRLCHYQVDIFDENREQVARFTATGYKKR